MPSEIKHLYSFGPFTLDEGRGLLFRDGALVQLTPKAFDTLLVLVRSKGDVVTKDELMKAVWPDTFVEETNLAQNISVVRKSLGENGDGHQYIETVPKRGYRFAAEVKETSEGGVTKTEAALSPQPGTGVAAQVSTPRWESPAAEHERPLPELPPGRAASSDQSTRVRARYFWLLVLVIAAGLAAAMLVLYSRRHPGSSSHEPRTLAILPFANDGKDRGAETEYLGFGLADTITTRLDSVGNLVVRPSAYVRKYRNLENLDPKAVAKELNANTLLVGSFSKDGDDFRISAQLFDVDTNKILWSRERSLKYEGMLTVRDAVARDIIDGLRLTLSPAEAERFKRDVPADPTAFKYYIQGVDQYQTNNFKIAIEMLKSSIELDPHYARAWAELGTAYTAHAAFEFGGARDYALAQSAYEKALELNPDQVEARIFLANLFTDTNRVEQAVPLLRQALAATPNNPLARWELSYSYRFGGMLPESIAEGEVARKLDPAVKINNSAFNSYLYDGQYERFLESLPAVDDSAFIMFYRGFGYYFQGDRSRAVTAFNRAYEIERAYETGPSPYAQIGKALSYGITGRSQEGLALLGKTEKRIEDRGVSEAEAIYKIAQAYAALGDKAAALRALRRSVDSGFFCYPYFLRDPALLPLRSESEYSSLMELARQRHEQFKSRFF